MRDDDFFLNKADTTHLRELLTTTIPALVEDLAITTSRQDRISRPELSKIRRGKHDSVVPINFGAAGATIELHNALVSAVRHMCEERALTFVPPKTVEYGFVGPLRLGWRRISPDYVATMLDLVGWLKLYVVSFALTEGAQDFYQDIAGATKAALRAVDLPQEDDIVIDDARVQAANRQVVTADVAERIASRLGDMGKGLTAARVRLLRKKGHLRPCSSDPDTRENFYRLGDVLDAHHRIGRRKAAS